MAAHHPVSNPTDAHLVVVGLGYVGLPLAQEAVRSGLAVTGFDIAAPTIEALNAGGTLDENTIYEFSINFKPNQQDFSATQYGVEFRKVAELSEKYGNAVRGSHQLRMLSSNG